jgi:hypothetical protein
MAGHYAHNSNHDRERARRCGYSIKGLVALLVVRQPPGPARESSHVLPRSSACLGLPVARFHLDQLTCFSNTEFITDSTHFHVPTLVPLIRL